MENRHLQCFAVASLMAVGFGTYLYTSVVTPPIVHVASPIANPSTLVKAKSVKVKAYLDACDKLQVAIPLDTGFTTQSDDMRVARGYVENIGTAAVQFVQVQVIWKDKNNKVLDADTLFATTDNALNPGDKMSFQTSTRNYLIAKCHVRVVDWWVVDQAKMEG